MDIFHLDLIKLIETVGYLGLFAIVFAESGLLIGAFLPGDSLLFTAGFLASQGVFEIRLLTPFLFLFFPPPTPEGFIKNFYFYKTQIFLQTPQQNPC